MEAGSSARPPLAPEQESRGLMMRQRLANVTRRIRWTYSIFWSFSPEQRVLVWGEGYLDSADSTELSLRRSQQLRNLYNAMNASTAGAQTFSPEIPTFTGTSPSVSAQDLTPLEWFYVGSMAVIYASGDGLPGRALAGQGYVWHYVTGERDTRVLVRARLAQRAHLQTIICFPALDGVVEIGTTALVEQDPNLLQQMQSLFLEQPMQHPNLRASSSTRTTGQAMESRAPGEMSRPTAFKRWETAMAAAALPPVPKYPQWMMKTAVVTLPRLYALNREVHFADFPTGVVANSSMQSFYGGPSETSRGVSGQSKHVMAERRRREELNKRFETLRKIVPFVSKPNKEALLADAIEYVVELERQVRELESTAKRRSEETIKQDVDVTIEKSMVFMKISSAWRDDQLVDILHKMEDLQLEVVDVNAEVFDNKLKATLKAKVRSSDLGNEENKTAEIRAAILNLIEGKLKGKAIVPE